MRKLSHVDCKYGAPMGRHAKGLTGNVGPVKFHLQTVRLDSGGYDSGGAYWGHRPRELRTVDNTPPDAAGKVLHTFMDTKSLYWFWWSGNRRPWPVPLAKPILIEGFIDAFDREDAKAQIREEYPEATFYR